MTATNTTPTITASIDEAQKIVNDAYRNFVTSYDWSFLKPEWQLTTIVNQWEYELPQDYKRLITPLHFSLSDAYPPVRETTYEDIIYRRSVSDIDMYPERYATRAGTYDKDIGQRYMIVFYPTPDSSYTLHGRMEIMPVKLDSDADLPIGGAEFSGVLKQLCLAEAESSQDEVVGVQQQKAQAMLGQAMMNDSRKNPRTLGYLADKYYQNVVPSNWDVARGGARVSEVKVYDYNDNLISDSA